MRVLVKTPWSEEEIPFTQAAEIGTDKVMGSFHTISAAVLRTAVSGNFQKQLSGAEEDDPGAEKSPENPSLCW